MKFFCIFLLYMNISFAETGEKKQLDIVDEQVDKAMVYLEKVDEQINFIDNKKNEIDNYEIKIITPIVSGLD